MKYYITNSQIKNIFEVLNNIQELIESFKGELTSLQIKQRIKQEDAK